MKRRPKDTEIHKYCTTCETLLPRSSFHRDRHQADGLTHACRTCRGNSRRRGWLVEKWRLAARYQARKADKWKARAQRAEAALKNTRGAP